MGRKVERKDEEFNGFWQASRQWYAKGGVWVGKGPRTVDEVHITIGALPEGGCRYGFFVRWVLLGGKPVLRLLIFSDAWDVFKEVPELFELFAECSTSWPDSAKCRLMMPKDLCHELTKMGFIDQTVEVEGEGPVGLKH